jgi:PhoPQ-activated pathogenicity-related protein
MADTIDDPLTDIGWQMMDPLSFPEQLKKIPKLVLLSSNDEYMQMDWSNIWADELGLFDDYGETHMQIALSDHSGVFLLTGGGSSVATLARSIASGKTIDDRPAFKHSYNNETGEITVTVTQGKPMRVVLHHAKTAQTKRRDFRWARLITNMTEPCTFPNINKKISKFDACLTILAIPWQSIELAESATEPGVYRALPPNLDSLGDHWVGYYIELDFDGNNLDDEWRFPHSF